MKKKKWIVPQTILLFSQILFLFIGQNIWIKHSLIDESGELIIEIVKFAFVDPKLLYEEFNFFPLIFMGLLVVSIVYYIIYIKNIRDYEWKVTMRLAIFEALGFFFLWVPVMTTDMYASPMYLGLMAVKIASIVLNGMLTRRIRDELRGEHRGWWSEPSGR